MENDDRFVVYRVYESPSVERVGRFGRSFERKKRKKGKKLKNKPEDSFKDDFLKHFGLDKGAFSVNLIKSEDRWVVEICNRKTGVCVNQDYQTLCNIMDRKCGLPSLLVGLNVNREA